MQRRVLSVAVMTAVLSVSACSSAASSTSPTATGGAQSGTGFTADALCALATQAEVGAALGGAVGPGVPSGVNAPACDWQDSNGGGLTIAAAGASEVGQIPYGIQNLSGAHLTAVSGLGDKAFFASGATGTTAVLDILKNGRAIAITVSNADPNFTQAQQEAAELGIGTAAAARM